MPVSDFKPAPVVSRSAKSKNSKEKNNPASADAHEHSPESPVDLEKSGFAAEAEAKADSENEFSDIASYSDRLHRAMAAVDIQLALEDLDREESQLGARSAMTPDSDDDLALEELLFRELSEGSDTPVTENPISSIADEDDGADGDADDNDEQDAIVGLATLHVERACRDVIDEAKSDALMRRIVRQRKEAMNMAVTSEDESEPDYDVDLPDSDIRNSFTTAFTARRLSYATAAVAILALGVYASSNINNLPVLNDVFAGKADNPVSTNASMTAVPNTVLVTRTVESASPTATAPEPVVAPASVEENATVVKQAMAAVQTDPSPLLAAPLTEEATTQAAPNPDPVTGPGITATNTIAPQAEETAGITKTAAIEKARPIVKLVKDPVVKSPAAKTAANAVQAVNSVVPVPDAPNIQYSNSYAATGEAGSKNFNTNQSWNENLSARMGSESQPASNPPEQPDSLGNVQNRDTLTDEDRRLAALPDDPPLLVPENKLGNPDGSAQQLGRSEQAVEQALSQSLGLDGVGKQARADLKSRLVAGECLSTALSEVLGQVPIVAMRDLILSLDSEC